MIRAALLAAAALALAGCGSTKDDAVQRAVDSVNSGTATFHLQEFVEKNGTVATCRITPRPEREGEMLLTVVTESEHWLQATIDLEQPVAGQDITTGRHLEPARAAEVAAQGETCAVSRENGTVSLN